MDFRPVTLTRELTDAIDRNKAVTTELADRVGALHGKDFMPRRAAQSEEDPRNTWYQWVTYFAAEVAGGRPFCDATTNLDPELMVEEELSVAEMVEGYRDAVNAHARKTRLEETIERLVPDYSLAPHAHACVYRRRDRKRDRLLQRERKATGDQSIPEAAFSPIVRRNEADHQLFDPTRIEEEDWRWTAHLEIRDVSELEWENRNLDAKWDIARLLERPYTQNTEQAGSRTWRDTLNYMREDLVAYWVMHCRTAEPRDVRAHRGKADDDKHTPENGWNGAYFYMPWSVSSAKEDVMVRPPEMAFGPEDGPHVFLGAMPIPGTAFRCPTLVANNTTIRARAAFERAVNRAGELYKRFIASGQKPDGAAAAAVAQAIKDTAHNGIVYIPGLTKDSYFPVEVFGVTPQMLTNLERLQMQEDQAIGLSEEARGHAGGSTATAASLAAGATSRRMGYSGVGFRRGVSRIYEKLAWYAWWDSSFVVDTDNGSVFQGGLSGNDVISWDDMGIELHYHSMRYKGEADQKEELGMALEILGNHFPLLPQIGGYTRTDEAFEMVKRLGGPDMERLINQEGLAGAVALLAQGQLQGTAPTPEVRPTGRMQPQSNAPRIYTNNARAQGNGSGVPAPTTPGSQPAQPQGLGGE